MSEAIVGEAPFDTRFNAPVFQLWSTFNGLLHIDDTDKALASSLFGFHNDSDYPESFAMPSLGTFFGFVSHGQVMISNQKISWLVTQGQWFCIPDGCTGILSPRTKLVAVAKHNYHGLYAMGGPVEPRGRLRYIDGCSDTLLIAPPLLGDPCFNLLHFPPGIRQTPHTHPSTRMGMVIGGKGVCEFEDKTVALNVGDIFHIPTGRIHNFCTEGHTLDVVAYHPDSDWGPEHEDHPMINRTWVDGKKIHQQALN
jgi:quercetin dioxygenase-like cupin family protein